MICITLVSHINIRDLSQVEEFLLDYNIRDSRLTALLIFLISKI